MVVGTANRVMTVIIGDICIYGFFAGKFLTELSLRFRFQDEVKRGLGGSAELAEPGLFHDLA